MKAAQHRSPPPPRAPIAPQGMAKVDMIVRTSSGVRLEFNGIICAEVAGASFMDIIKAAEEAAEADRAPAQGAEGQEGGVA